MDANNLVKSWKSWREGFTLYMGLAMPDADETARMMLFHYLMGYKTPLLEIGLFVAHTV